MIILFNSCFRCSCDCNLCSGCTSITAKEVGTDSIISKKTFCSQINLSTDKNIQDSIELFKMQFAGQAHVFITKDSISDCDTKTNISCKEAEKLKDHTCMCAK